MKRNKRTVYSLVDYLGHLRSKIERLRDSWIAHQLGGIWKEDRLQKESTTTLDHLHSKAVVYVNPNATEDVFFKYAVDIKEAFDEMKKTKLTQYEIRRRIELDTVEELLSIDPRISNIEIQRRTGIVRSRIPGLRKEIEKRKMEEYDVKPGRRARLRLVREERDDSRRDKHGEN